MNEATISHFPRLGLSFSTEEATAGAVEPSLRQSWNQLVAQSQSPETVFQTPDYFEFITAVPAVLNTQKVVVVRETTSQSVVGVLPVRAGRRTLFLALGGKAIARLRIHSITLLGSVPLVPLEGAVLEELFDYIFANFPHTGSIAMQAVPADSVFYRALVGSTHLRQKYGIYIKDGWRACQTTPLPASYADYLAHFKAKKRYNLQRQLKLLEKASGALRLTCIDRPEHVPLLLATIRQIALPFIQGVMMNESQYLALLQKKIALCYVLHGGEQPCAVVIGIRSETTYHLHNILYDQALAGYSPGTSILHLAIRDLIEHQRIGLIDYGYGDPQHSHQTSNVTRLRSHIFIYRKTWANRLRLATYSAFGVAVEWGKRLRATAWRKPALAGTNSSS